ncbi:L,D-transpeptidase family protein [Thiocapsa bogorovii]|uniref:L,D-transpeptidase family protein n=1 Tax=Thiocapsa bogorovii TaxID=521689 RepID=UPI001E5040DA|nr:L,D-transpeptidase family protein [Thiocapsa bogorovii]UHD15534.1 L,D-transpeptidase family protein [Thiocapsa bogorovii]
MHTHAKHPMNAIDEHPVRRPEHRAHRIRYLLTALAVAGALGLVGCGSTSKMATVDSNHADKVVVKKSQRKLELHSNGRVIREYRIALGGAPDGHKFREGDERTPIGDYFLNWRNPNSNFYKSIHISYPNERDKLVSRSLGYSSPGGMIMIHGLPNYVRSEALRQQYANRDWTQGCIAVQNHEIDEIWSMVRDGTPIKILP